MSIFVTYTTLEPGYTSFFSPANGAALGFDTSQALSLLTSTSFLYTAGIMLSVVAAGVMYMRAGAIRMQSSERAVSKSNEEIKRVTLGLLGVLSLFVIIYTFNRDLLKGDVGLEGLRTSGRAGAASLSQADTSSRTTSASCLTEEQTIASLSQQGGFCKNATCTALQGCAYEQYLPIIERESSRYGVNKNLVIAVMCQESRGKPTESARNQNGTYDCGLMQINQTGSCSPQVLDPSYNIAKGVERLKQAQNSASQVYQNIPQEAGIYASYNCCANGTIPNSPSADCTTNKGYPFSIPKWACPINPGTSDSNMCTVRSTSCGVAACVYLLDGM